MGIAVRQSHNALAPSPRSAGAVPKATGSRGESVLVAGRLKSIAPFRVMELMKRAAQLEAEGHRVVHFEVGGSDAAKLVEFYAGMFDWQVHLHEETNYRLVQQEPGGIGGGIFEHVEGMPPNTPSVAVLVSDLQAYLDRAVSLGGSALMPPTEIPGGYGSMAIFFDIAGNRISLFRSPE